MKDASGRFIQLGRVCRTLGLGREGSLDLCQDKESGMLAYAF